MSNLVSERLEQTKELATQALKQVIHAAGIDVKFRQDLSVTLRVQA